MYTSSFLGCTEWRSGSPCSLPPQIVGVDVSPRSDRARDWAELSKKRRLSVRGAFSRVLGPGGWLGPAAFLRVCNGDGMVTLASRSRGWIRRTIGARRRLARCLRWASRRQHANGDLQAFVCDADRRGRLLLSCARGHPKCSRHGTHGRLDRRNTRPVALPGPRMNTATPRVRAPATAA